MPPLALLLSGLVLWTWTIPGSLGLVSSLTRSKTPSRMVRIWRNDPFEEGYRRQRMAVPQTLLAMENVTDVMGSLLGAVVEHQSGDETALFRIFFSTFDLPLPPLRTHLGSVLFDAKHWNEFSYNLNAQVDGQLPAVATLSTLEARELAFSLPARLLQSHAAVIALNLTITYKNEATVWLFSMRSHLHPYTKKAICMKPLYNRTSLEELVECGFRYEPDHGDREAEMFVPIGRAHHELLGFEAVHWQGRDRHLASEVSKMNAIQGLSGYDTFE